MRRNRSRPRRRRDFLRRLGLRWYGLWQLASDNLEHEPRHIRIHSTVMQAGEAEHCRPGISPRPKERKLTLHSSCSRISKRLTNVLSLKVWVLPEDITLRHAACQHSKH